MFAFDSRQHLFHIVETAHETRAQVESFRAMRCARFGASAHHRQPSAQGVVDDGAEWPIMSAHLRLELYSDIIIKGQRRPHILMVVC